MFRQELRMTIFGLLLSLAGTSIAHAQRNMSAGSPAENRRPVLVPQRGHAFGVNSVAFSPEGSLVVTATREVTCLWDTETGKELGRLQGTDKLNNFVDFSSVAFTPDGNQLLTRGLSAEVRLWDVATGKEVRVFTGGEKLVGVSAATLSPDGKQLLIASVYTPVIKALDIATSKELRTFRGNDFSRVSSIAFSPDGKLVLSVTGGQSSACLWNFTTEKVLRRFAGDCRHSAFAPDGTKIVLAGDKTVQLWDLSTGKKLRPLQGNNVFSLTGVAFSPDGKQVLAGDYDHTARLWDVATGKQLRTFKGHSGAVNSVAFSPDGKRVLTGSDDRTARLFDVASGSEVRRFEGRFHWARSLAFSRDGKQFLAGGDDQTARLWDLFAAKRLRAFSGQRAEVVALSPDGRQALTASQGGGSVHLWDAETGDELRPLRGGQSLWVFCAAFSPDGKRVLAGCMDGSIFLWNTASGELVQKLQDPRSLAVATAVISPEGRWLVFAGHVGPEVHLWNTATGKHVRTWQLPSATTTGYGISPEGKRSTYTADIQDHAESLAISPDGNQVLAGCWGRIARLWDVASGKELQTFRGHSRQVTSVAFCPDGKHVLTGSWDETARLWDVATSKEVRRFGSQSGSEPPIAVLVDGKRVLAGSRDASFRLSDVAKGQELARLIVSSEGLLSVTPEGFYNASREVLRSVAFRVANRAFPFEQFDLKFNRPDIVLNRVGLAPRELIDADHQAYLKRLRRMNFNEDMLGDDFHLPEIRIESDTRFTTPETKLTLKVDATDSKYLLDRVNLAVNGVPVHGTAGINLRDQKLSAWEQVVDITLCTGKNLIQVSVLNEKGAESLQETREIFCEAPASRPDLYLAAIGVSAYQDRRFNLTYADKDARDLAAFFETKKDHFGAIHALPIVNEEVTRDKILRIKDWLMNSRVDDEVIIFIAGHGLLDRKQGYYFSTTDIDFNDPSRQGLSYEAIEELLDGIPARRKLLLMDTCFSGEQDEDTVAPRVPEGAVEGTVNARGFRGLEPLDRPKLGLGNTRELLSDLFADLRRGTGAVVISAAGGMEFALEAPSWKNGVFTYAILDGLKSNKADRNQDGHVQVSELRDFVLEAVRRLTGGRQSPTIRRENLEFDFRLY
jgi:WD40 repeat protein